MRSFRIGQLSNQYQGPYKRVLCVCSGGLLRSATMAHVLCKAPYDYNTRSCGTNKTYALNMITDDLIIWADEIICADTEHEIYVRERLFELGAAKTVQNLGIPDDYEYRHPELIQMIEERVKR